MQSGSMPLPFKIRHAVQLSSRVSASSKCSGVTPPVLSLDASTPA